jgi:hypothetical protein
LEVRGTPSCWLNTLIFKTVQRIGTYNQNVLCT